MLETLDCPEKLTFFTNNSHGPLIRLCSFFSLPTIFSSYHLAPWNYACQMGIKAADDIKAASQLILKQREYPGLSRWLQYHQLKAGERV